MPPISLFSRFHDENVTSYFFLFIFRLIFLINYFLIFKCNPITYSSSILKNVDIQCHSLHLKYEMLVGYNQKGLNFYSNNNSLYCKKELFYCLNENFYQCDYVIFHFTLIFFVIEIYILYYQDLIFHICDIILKISLK